MNDSPTRGATTLIEVHDKLRAEGFAAQLIATGDGEIRCATCGTASPPGEFEPAGQTRLEGASDAADLSLVVWGACPSCDAAGVLTLGYGPNATAGDEAILRGIPDADDRQPGSDTD